MTNVIFFQSMRHNHKPNVNMTDPKCFDVVNRLVIQFIKFGISGNSCIVQETTQDKTMTKAQVSNIEKFMYATAIGFLAEIALERDIGFVTAGYMYNVLIQEGLESDAWKRLHGERFPRDLTEAGWRSSFTALSDYIEGWID